MPKTFFLIKFFDNLNYADAFVRGQLYLNRLTYFKQVEGEQQDPTGRQDRHEGTTAWFQPGMGKLTINGVLVNDAQITVQKHWLNHLHICCLHAIHSGNLDLDRIAAENDMGQLRDQLAVPDECIALGNHAVVIRDVPAFIRRISSATETNGFRLKYGLVNYYDPATFHGQFTDEDSVFCKQSRYMFQREFRFAINSGTLDDNPLVLNVGDIRNISIRLKSSELNGEKLIGGDIQFKIQ